MANDILYLGNKYYSDTEELKKLLEESDENIKEELLCALRNGNLKQWLLLEKKQQEPIDYLKRRREREERRKEKENNKQEETKRRKDIANTLPTDFGSEFGVYENLCKSFNIETDVKRHFKLSEYLKTDSIICKIADCLKSITIENNISRICYLNEGIISINLKYNYNIIKQKGEIITLQLWVKNNELETAYTQNKEIDLSIPGNNICEFNISNIYLDKANLKGITFKLELKVMGQTEILQETMIMNNELTLSYNNKNIVLIRVSDYYYMGKFVVTEELWNTIMGKNTIGSPQMPITSITYNEIVNIFLPKLNKKIRKEGYVFDIPTVEQWKYAAKGGEYSKGFEGAGSNNLMDIAWMCANSNNMLHEVGKKEPNEIGLYDMCGNVFEFCHSSQPNTPTLCGGSYKSLYPQCSIDNSPRGFSSNETEENKRNISKEDIGFRLILIKFP